MEPHCDFAVTSRITNFAVSSRSWSRISCSCGQERLQVVAVPVLRLRSSSSCEDLCCQSQPPVFRVCPLTSTVSVVGQAASTLVATCLCVEARPRSATCLSTEGRGASDASLRKAEERQRRRSPCRAAAKRGGFEANPVNSTATDRPWANQISKLMQLRQPQGSGSRASSG